MAFPFEFSIVGSLNSRLVFMGGIVSAVALRSSFVVAFVDGTEKTVQKAEMLEGVRAYQEREKCTPGSFINTRADAEALWQAAGGTAPPLPPPRSAARLASGGGAARGGSAAGDAGASAGAAQRGVPRMLSVGDALRALAASGGSIFMATRPTRGGDIRRPAAPPTATPAAADGDSDEDEPDAAARSLRCSPAQAAFAARCQAQLRPGWMSSSTRIFKFTAMSQRTSGALFARQISQSSCWSSLVLVA